MGVFGHGSKLASVAFLPYLAWIALAVRQPDGGSCGPERSLSASACSS